MFEKCSDKLSLLFFMLILPGRILQYGYEFQSSPCPKVFIYLNDEQRGGLYGEIQVARRFFETMLQLNIELSVGNIVQGYNGNIELAKPREEIIKDILNNRPVLYKVFFPVWTNIPPKITKVIVNGNLICSGPGIPVNVVPYITTIHLHHTLKIDVLPLSFPKPSVENNIFATGNVARRSQSNGISPQGYEFNPQVHGSSFRPYSGQADSNNVYQLNPSIPNNPTNFHQGNGYQQEADDRPYYPDVKPSSTDPPLRKNLFFDFDPGRPRPEGNRTNPLLGTPSEHEYRPGGVFREWEDKKTEPPLRTNVFNNFRPAKPPPNGNRRKETLAAPSLNNYRPVGVVRDQGNKPFQLSSTQSPFYDSSYLEPQRDKIGPAISYSDFSPKVTPGNNAPTSGPFDNVCGKPVSTNQLIINGNEVPRGAYPWIAAIFAVKPTGLSYMCSASLISDRQVVTAAHCMKTEHKAFRPNELLIVLGKLNIQKWVPTDGEKMVEVESIHIHPDYKHFTSDADIGILTLNERIAFTKYISPLCVWRGNSELERIVGGKGTVVGWGKDENGILMTDEPKQTQLPIVSQEMCLRSSYQFQYITSNRTFCAGHRNGSGPCNGDSGSGFIMQQQGRWTLRGIVSMSISSHHSKTCDLSNYVVFTDASKFTKWILSFIT